MRTLTVGEMMTSNVKVLPEHETLTSADWDMALGEVRHMPVVDAERRVIGIVSDRDVLRGLAERHNYPIRVTDIMTRNLRTVTTATPAAEAVEYMLKSKYHAIVVVDEGRHVVGLVTATDFLELAHRALEGFDIAQPHVRG